MMQSTSAPPAFGEKREVEQLGSLAGAESAPALAAQPTSHGDVSEVWVTFVEAGPLGVALSPSGTYAGHTEILAVNAGTQATQHSQLRAGLLLAAVGSTLTAGLTYEEVISLLSSTT